MDVSTIIMICILGFLIVLMVLGTLKRKKENGAVLEMRENLKVGDKVMTSDGLYGEIVDKSTVGDNELVTLKTGSNDHVGFLQISINAIYYIFDENGEADFMGLKAKASRDATASVKEDKEEPKQEDKTETKTENK